MKNEKKNSGMLVGILIGIVLMLLVVGCLFATGTISFKETATNNNGQTSENSQTSESNNMLTESEALSVLKSKVDFAEKYFTTFQNPCGDGAEINTSIPQKNGMPYYESKQYHTFNELNDSLLQYMSQNIINIRTQYTKDNYLEQNGKLYCYMIGGGSLVGYQPEKTEYTITNITNNSITANVISYVESDDASMTEYNEKRNISVELTKNSDNWQITKYEGNKINFFNS